MKWFVWISLLLFASCSDGIEEDVIAERLARNNELLEKQVNLLDRAFLLNTSDSSENPAIMLYEVSETRMSELEKELEDYQNMNQSIALFKETIAHINDSMKSHSGLLIDWWPEEIDTEDPALIRSWKRNNFLLLRISILEKCLELYEEKSKSASVNLIPVVYSSQFYQVQHGNNAMFDIAFKSKKPELVEFKIQKATLNKVPIDKKNIEIDRYTQRFILFNLQKGNYLIEGELLLINEIGEKEAYPFHQEFYVN